MTARLFLHRVPKSMRCWPGADPRRSGDVAGIGCRTSPLAAPGQDYYHLANRARIALDHVYKCPMDGLTAGRPESALEDPWQGKDATFASARLDGQELVDAEYRHCTFINVSFKSAKLTRSRFIDCIFVDCYFRQSDLRQSSFTGCRFVDCLFSKVAIVASDFRYARFRGCHPSFADFSTSMPIEPNLRIEVAEQCAIAAEQAGDVGDARRYRLAVIEARNLHLRAAVAGETQWYRDHFDTIARLSAVAELAWHRLNRALWLHGESARRLLGSLLLFLLVLFPVINYIALGPGNPLSEVFWWGVGNFLSLDLVDLAGEATGGALVAASMEAAIGVLFFGLFVTVLIKRLSKR